MSARRIARHRRRRGIAAVEFALALPLLLLLLVLPLYFGRVFWHYAAFQKAAQNSARYLASIPVTSMTNAAKIGYSVQLANEIVRQHVQDINPGTYPLSVTILCDGINCDGLTKPSTVRIVVRTYVQDIFFPDISAMSILVSADVSTAYVGK